MAALSVSYQRAQTDKTFVLEYFLRLSHRFRLRHLQNLYEGDLGGCVARLVDLGAALLLGRIDQGVEGIGKFFIRPRFGNVEDRSVCTRGVFVAEIVDAVEFNDKVIDE